MVRLLVGLYYRTYLNHYGKLRPDKNNELRRWYPVIAVARLDEQIERNAKH